MPHRVLVGEKDGIRQIVDFDPEAEIVPGIGHFLPEEAPEVVLAEIHGMLH